MLATESKRYICLRNLRDLTLSECEECWETDDCETQESTTCVEDCRRDYLVTEEEFAEMEDERCGKRGSTT